MPPYLAVRRHWNMTLNMPLTLALAAERWPIAGSFTISRGAKTEAEVVVAELGDGTARGRGECVPYARYGESVEASSPRSRRMRPQLAAGLDRARPADGDAAGRRAQCARLRVLGPRGQAQRARRCMSSPACPPRTPLVTAYTISLGTPAAMAAAAAKAAAPRRCSRSSSAADGDAERAHRRGARRGAQARR